jgi:beta-glucanase (GH16 family)
MLSYRRKPSQGILEPTPASPNDDHRPPKSSLTNSHPLSRLPCPPRHVRPGPNLAPHLERRVQRPQRLTFGNNEQETYTARPANIQQRDGNLVITARKEDLIGPDGAARNYTSARINTQNHFTQKYGRFEARIKLPTGKGIWPAFWLLGNDHETHPWPDCGEIDILEAIGARDTIYSTIHGPGYSGRLGPSQKFVLPPGQQIDTAFHLYAVEWSPNEIKFFLDDHLIVERTPADLPPDTRWVYDHPFYLILNLAVGGHWPGYPDKTTTFPQQMLVDYVRVYSREPAAVEAQP